MSKAERPVLSAFLDASVLYPSLIRNLLMHLAVAGIVRATWSDEVHREWMANLAASRPDILPKRLERTLQLMKTALPDANVSGHEPLIPTLTLPDPDDRHVLAAAIVGQVEVIVTWNLRHFPAAMVQPHGLEALSPDALVVHLLTQAPTQTRAALEALRVSLRRPPYTLETLLSRLEQVGLVRAVAELRREPPPYTNSD